MSGMPEFAHILLASHDTPGAHAAERAAFDLCGAHGRLSHLIVVMLLVHETI